ncbi:hypothetical protein PCURB6_40860 [Paenibacillus curdlanolyticus]|nr:hypothetical protein PCURB6_40860 [Paenibacillus curdlanolyticus]
MEWVELLGVTIFYHELNDLPRKSEEACPALHGKVRTMIYLLDYKLLTVYEPSSFIMRHEWRNAVDEPTSVYV